MLVKTKQIEAPTPAQMDALLDPAFTGRFTGETGFVPPKSRRERLTLSERQVVRGEEAGSWPARVQISESRSGVPSSKQAEFEAHPPRWRALYGRPFKREQAFAKALRAEAIKRGIIKPESVA
jgi:hypothetical protein